MKAKDIEPFVVATKLIINQVLGTTPNFTENLLKKDSIEVNELSVVIGVTGHMNGKVIIDLEKRNCLKIVSKMMGGMEIEFNDIAKSAIGELVNMIMGKAATLYANQGLECQITTPTIFEKGDFNFDHPEEVICLPFDISDNIKLGMNIAVD